ncbi:MAG: putative bifunctional diguanylate cyclase/phosphodiesterase [Spirochaetota bacterium]
MKYSTDVNAYEEIVNRSSDYITLINRDYVYEIANDAYCRQIGRSREQVVGHTVAEVWGYDRFDSAIRPNLDRCFGGEQVNYVDRFTFGEIERSIHVSFFPYMRDGMTTHVLVFSHDITRLSQVEEKLTNYELRDSTTGLFNRRSMEIIVDKELEQARRTDSSPRAVMFIFVDNLSQIIDLYGHQTGDLLLENTGLRVARCLESGDYAFRSDGNELAVLITTIRDRVELATTATRILHEITLPYQYGGATLAVGARIGIAIFPNDGKTREELVRNAHVAMSDARQRRAPYVFFDSELHRAIQARLALGAELGSAVKDGQFQLNFQPIVNTKGTAIGAEALLRWHHPDRGLLMPNEVIPIAVESELMVSIGRWVLFEACNQVKRWSRDRDFFVTVNMTAGEFLDRHMLESVKRAMTRSGIEPSQLKLEITESESMADPEAAIERIETLQTAGVDVLIDDFGTGQSSLSYLRNLPARILKLDQSFTADLADPDTGHSFLGHMIAAMKSLSKIIVLEGVESPEEARDAVRLGFDLLQGDYFGPAVPPAEFDLFLSQKATARR